MPRTLYLIDGHAQIFRAYFAIRAGGPAMSSPTTGEPTHAVFAFAGMMFKFFEQFQPELAVMAIDLPGPTFRAELDPQYKATREKIPDDFRVQERRIFDMTRLFGIPILSQPGAEADDVIATCVRRVLDDPASGDLDIRIISRDKDLEQLLSDRVAMYDIHKDALISPATLLADKGITPGQVVDLLSLVGDKVDNIPGVDGVGIKTAAGLLQQYGDIDGIYSHIDEIKGKRRENLEAAQDRMPLNRQLVKLRDDLDLAFTPATAQLRPPDAAGLKALFRELGFRRHGSEVDRLFRPTAPAATRDDGGFATGLFDGIADDKPGPEERLAVQPAEVEGDYHVITTQAELDALVQAIRGQKLLSVDTETIGLGHHAPPCGISLAWKPGHGVYVPLRSPDPSRHLPPEVTLAALKPVLEDPGVGKTGHNLKYDMHALRHVGIQLRGVVFDSMIAAALLDLPGRSLDDLALLLLQRRNISIATLIGEDVKGRPQRTMDQVELARIGPYAAEDADVALRLHDLLQPQIVEQGMAELAERVEMPLVEVLAAMEAAGIRVDPDELERQKLGFVERIAELRDQVQAAAGVPFNPDSPRQLADVLFNQLKLPVIKRNKTGPSTDVEVLEKLADSDDLTAEQSRVPTMIVEYRQITKLVNTYLDNLRDSRDARDGRVHASFHQTGAATGRLSSSGPNLQNIPIRTEQGRLIRKAFLPEPGWRLISADYSQIELRILAHLSEDPALIAAFRRDEDIHAAVAAQVFNVPLEQVSREQRASAKVINFGIIYGVTAFGLARRIEGLDKAGARKLIDDYRTRFAGIDRFLDQCVQQAEQLGHVTTIMGRRRSISQITSSNPATRELGKRLAINSVVQGSAADLIKLAMVNLHRRIERDRLPLRMLLQIHDELVLESPAADADAMAEIVKTEMQQAMSLRVPLKVDAGLGEDWWSCK